MEVPVPALELHAGQRAHLTLSFRTDADLAWAPAGHEVAWEQVELGRVPGRSRAPGAAPAVPRTLESLEPAIVLWRAPIDNETFGPGHAQRWERLGLREAGARVDATTDVVEADGGGSLVAHTVDLPDALDDIPRVGVRLRLGPGVRTVEWLGDGPHECYSDRRASARFGRWTTAVDDWPVPYVHPQASGNRMGVRWLRFLDADGEPVLTIDELDDLEVTVAASPTRSWPLPATSRSFRRARRVLRVDRRAPARRRLGRVRSRHRARAPDRSRNVPLVVPSAVAARLHRHHESVGSISPVDRS